MDPRLLTPTGHNDYSGINDGESLSVVEKSVLPITKETTAAFAKVVVLSIYLVAYDVLIIFLGSTQFATVRIVLAEGMPERERGSEICSALCLLLYKRIKV